MDFNSGKAIYLQIVDHVCEQIMLGHWGVGDKIPSREDKGKYSIKHLSLISKGKSTIEFNHGLSVNQVEGQLSDSTSTNLPIYMLRSLIK